MAFWNKLSPHRQFISGWCNNINWRQIGKKGKKWIRNTWLSSHAPTLHPSIYSCASYLPSNRLQAKCCDALRGNMRMTRLRVVCCIIPNHIVWYLWVFPFWLFSYLRLSMVEYLPCFFASLDEVLVKIRDWAIMKAKRLSRYADDPGFGDDSILLSRSSIY